MYMFDLWVREILWRRKQQRTKGLLPWKSHGRSSLGNCSPRGCKESDTAEWLNNNKFLSYSFRLSTEIYFFFNFTLQYCIDFAIHWHLFKVKDRGTNRVWGSYLDMLILLEKMFGPVHSFPVTGRNSNYNRLNIYFLRQMRIRQILENSEHNS